MASKFVSARNSASTHSPSIICSWSFNMSKCMLGLPNELQRYILGFICISDVISVLPTCKELFVLLSEFHDVGILENDLFAYDANL
jgi:hypothetical protein